MNYRRFAFLLLVALTFTSTAATSSSRDFFAAYQAISSASMTGTATVTSAVVDIRIYDNVAIQANYVGTAAGAFYVDISDDYNPITASGNWNTLSSTLSAPSGSSGSSYLEINQTAAAYIRVRYTNTSGSGTLNLYMGAKGL